MTVINHDTSLGGLSGAAESRRHVPTASRRSTRRIFAVGLMAAIVSATLNDAIAATASTVLNISSAFQPLQVGAVTVFTIGGVELGVLVFAVVARRIRRPMPVYAPLALIALALSWLPDYGLYQGKVFPETTVAGVLVLASLHAVTALVTIAFLGTLAIDERTSPPTTRRGEFWCAN